MKSLSFSELEIINGEGKNRTCAQLGMSTFVNSILGFGHAIFWGAAAGSVTGAIIYGCFD